MQPEAQTSSVTTSLPVSLAAASTGSASKGRTRPSLTTLAETPSFARLSAALTASFIMVP